MEVEDRSKISNNLDIPSYRGLGIRRLFRGRGFRGLLFSPGFSERYSARGLEAGAMITQIIISIGPNNNARKIKRKENKDTKCKAD